MAKKISIHIKASFLLLVFSLNTIVGSSCALGMSLDFNANYNLAKALEKVLHVHAGAAMDVHQEEPGSNHMCRHQDQAAKHPVSKESKDNCCNAKVIQYEQFDKYIPQSFAAISPVIFTTFVTSFFLADIESTFKGAPPSCYFFRSYHPPIPDIRIAIQSFQI